MSLGVPHLVREKSHHSKASISAHRGSLSCIDVTSQGYGMAPRVFTAGEDGALRIWEGRALNIIVETSALTRHRISCLSVSGQKVFMGTSGGEIIITHTDGTPISRFTAHKSVITCLQVVNRGRIFTGSTDGTVKFYGEDGEAIRQFPLNPKDSSEPILSLKATSANLIFTGSDQGVIRIYNLRQELLLVLKTRALDGVPLNLMEVIHANDKVSIICAHGTRLTMWYLTLVKDNFGEYEIIVDAVKSISSRMPNGRITAIKAVFVNPLRTNRPCVYLGNSNGLVQLIVPTGKFGSLYDQYNRRVLAPKFKQYTFKDVNGPVSSICSGGGRFYAGTIHGALFMFKECLAMLNLRKWSLGRPDTHGYRAKSAHRQSMNVLLEEIGDDEEPAQDPEAMRAFAKVADSDISESEFENENFFGEPTLVTLSESVPDSSFSSRSQRSSTTIASQAPSFRSQRASTAISSPAPSFQSHSNLSDSQDYSRAPPSPLVSQGRPLSMMSPSPAQPSPLTSMRTASPSPSIRSPNASAYETEIIRLLQDSAAELATLPEPRTGSNQNMDQLNQSMQRLSTSQTQRPMSFAYGTTPTATTIPAHSQQQRPVSQAPSAPQATPVEDQRCVVCLDSPRDSILYQCGHVCVCNPCGKQLIARKLNCPMCRAPIKDCIVLYR